MWASNVLIYEIITLSLLVYETLLHHNFTTVHVTKILLICFGNKFICHKFLWADECNKIQAFYALNRNIPAHNYRIFTLHEKSHSKEHKNPSLMSFFLTFIHNLYILFLLLFLVRSVMTTRSTPMSCEIIQSGKSVTDLTVYTQHSRTRIEQVSEALR